MKLLIELNNKFDDATIKKLLELVELQLQVLIDDLLKGKNSNLKIVSDNMDKIAFLAQNFLTYEQLNELFNKIKAAAQKAIDYADELRNLKIKVINLPYGSPATGDYDPETGYLTFSIPQGKPGVAPFIDVIDCGHAYMVWLTIIDGGTASIVKEFKGMPNVFDPTTFMDQLADFIKYFKEILVSGDEYSMNNLLTFLNRMSEQTALVKQYADNAKKESDKAKGYAEDANTYANLAIDMSGIGPASTDNFGFVKIGEGIFVDSNGVISIDADVVKAVQNMGSDTSGNVQIAKEVTSLEFQQLLNADQLTPETFYIEKEE